jgi:L-threonylcarbamoyladenylate synthase
VNEIIISQASNIIKNDGIVAFPTETVYGIGANALSEVACQKIYAIKERPRGNPLIVHVSSIEDAKKIAIFNRDAELLAKKLWPGPLSMVLPLREDANLAKSVTAGLNTVAIRIPSHPIALELIKISGVPIAAPSANPSGYVSPTSEEHVKSHFADLFTIPDIELYSKDFVGIESTILDLTTKNPTILRCGFITSELLSILLDKQILSYMGNKIVAPGMSLRHYSPKASVRLNVRTLNKDEFGIGFGDIFWSEVTLSKSGDLLEASQNLYSTLRLVDNMENVKAIAVAPIPEIGIGVAINDRLKRACCK